MTATTLEPQTVYILSALVLPLLVGLVTKAEAARKVRSVLLLTLASLSTLLTRATLDDGSAVLTQGLVWDVAVTWVVAVASYYGLWKPSGVSPAINDRTSEFGVTIAKDPAA